MTAPALLLLGAGASYGSEAQKSHAPPLASKLFDELLKYEPNVWGQVPADVAAILRADFEKGMIALNAKLPHALTICQRSMAAFFFRYGPMPNSLYLELATRVKSKTWCGAIATLNYERMLLLALASSAISTFCGDTKPPDGQLELCLPHGCCNFFCESARGDANAIALSGMSASTNGPIVVLDHPDAFWTRLRTDGFPPVMSYFEPSKFTTSGANFIEQQRQRFVELISNASTIGIVGIQVREDDSHIWQPLADTNARLYYCSGRQASDSFKIWQARTRGTKAQTDTVSTRYWDADFNAVAAHVGL